MNITIEILSCANNTVNGLVLWNIDNITLDEVTITNHSNGLEIDGEKVFALRTPRLRVVSASLLFDYIPDRSDLVNLLAVVEFNYPVDPGKAARAVRYAPAGTPSPVEESSTAPPMNLRPCDLALTEGKRTRPQT